MTTFLRLLRGLGALAILLGLVGGTPLLLLLIGKFPALSALPAVLLAPDDGSVLLWGLSALGWVAWGGFIWAVILEGVALIRGRRPRLRVPGLGGPRGPVAVLLVAIAAMVPLSAHAQPTLDGPASEPREHHPSVSHTVAPETAAEPAAAPSQDTADSGGYRYTVQRGDDLWTLAERFYGDGRAWSSIVAANPQITTPDAIDVGWELVLPGVSDPVAAQDPPEASTEPASAQLEEQGPVEEPEPESGPESGEAPKPVATPVALEATAAAEPDGQSAYAVAGISSLAAAALVGLLSTRRAVQLAGRKEGRRIIHPASGGQGLESALGHAQDPVSLRVLDLALRALGRHHREAGEPLPALRSVLVSGDEIVFEMDTLPERAPAGFLVEGSSLCVRPAAHDMFIARAGSLMAEPAPYPALVCLGQTPRGALQLHDLESAGSLVLDGPADLCRGMLNSLLLELTCSWWGRGQSVIVVAGDAPLAAALDDPAVHLCDDLDCVLADLTAERPRNPLRSEAHPRDIRIQPEFEEAWRPRLLLVGKELTHEQRVHLEDLVRTQRVIAVAVDPRLPGPRIVVTPELSRLVGGLPFHAQAMTAQSRDRLLDLLQATKSVETTAAPWWSTEDDEVESGPDVSPRYAAPMPPVPARAHPEPFPSPEGEENHATIVSLAARRAATVSEEPAMDAHEPVLHPSIDAQPTILLAGPVALIGTRGERPTRATRQCMEYAAWLLEHPGATAPMMASALVVAESTRRSNMSRLRAWLGCAEDGERYLPEAYSGRIQLHAEVTSDWNRMQLLTVGGVNRATEDNLQAVLNLVRGAPLADAAPGQWHWAEELRTDISSLVRDVGLVLCDRALASGDLDLARWAVGRALVAAPEDERLLCARVRTEHRAGNHSEVERLALRLVRSARKLNIDLADETVTLLQEVVEGEPRRRLG